MNNNHNPDELNISLIDIYDFLRASKKYLLVGAVLGLLFSAIYLASIEPMYQSKITIEAGPAANIPLTPVSITAEEIKERLLFSKTQDEILEKMDSKPSAQQLNALKQSIKSLKVTGGAKFIELTLVINSANSAELLLNDLGEKILSKITQWNEPRLRYLTKLIENNRLRIAQTKDATVIISLENINFNIQMLLDSPDLLKPQMIDGPTKAVLINPQTYFITLMKGLLLGLSLALCAAFLRMQSSKYRN